MLAETDCRFACYNHGFVIVYSGSETTLMTTYQGSVCDCLTRGFFVGTVNLGGNRSITASNRLNESLTMTPIVPFNQLVGTIKSADGSCSYVLNFEQGSLLGLPTAAPLRPSTAGVSPAFHVLTLTLALALAPALPLRCLGLLGQGERNGCAVYKA